MVSHEVHDAPFVHSYQRLNNHVCMATPAGIYWDLQRVITRIKRVRQYLEFFNSLDRSLRQCPLPRRSYFICLVLLLRSCNLTSSFLPALLPVRFRAPFAFHRISRAWEGVEWVRLRGVGSGAFLTCSIFVYPWDYFAYPM